MTAAHRLAAGDPDGPRVALVHGMEDGWQSWRPLAGALPRSWRVTAYDVPWRAGNDYRWRRGGTAGEWARRLIDRPADLVIAHSFGAAAVLEALAHRPALPVRAVALLAPVVRPPGLPLSWETFDRARAEFAVVIRDAVLVHLGSRACRVDEELRADMTDKMLHRIGPLGFLTLVEQFAATGDLPLHDVRGPVLVLSGGADSHAKSLAATLPDAAVDLIDDYGHFCHVEQTEDVARRLVEFVHTALPEWRPR